LRIVLAIYFFFNLTHTDRIVFIVNKHLWIFPWSFLVEPHRLRRSERQPIIISIGHFQIITVAPFFIYHNVWIDPSLPLIIIQLEYLGFFILSRIWIPIKRVSFWYVILIQGLCAIIVKHRVKSLMRVILNIRYIRVTPKSLCLMAIEVQCALWVMVRCVVTIGIELIKVSLVFMHQSR
jgi:hypothetical protein